MPGEQFNPLLPTGVTPENVARWQEAADWGDHAEAGYADAEDTASQLAEEARVRAEADNSKADASSVYSKGEVDTALSAKSNSGHTHEDLAAASRARVIGFIARGATVLRVGLQRSIVVPFACTITGWALVGVPVGTISIDILKAPMANHPDGAVSITADAPPTLVGQPGITSTDTTGWTTVLAAQDVLTFTISVADNVQECELLLQVTVTS